MTTPKTPLNATKVIFLEIRDIGTFIPAIAIVMSPHSLSEGARYLFRRSGWGPTQSGIYLMKLVGEEVHSDPYSWVNNRTMQAAHLHVEKEWPTLKDGDVIDVEFIMGASTEPKRSEREVEPL